MLANGTMLQGSAIESGRETPALAAAKPVKRRGRPPGTCKPPEKRRKPRTMRLTDALWVQLQQLGPAWLEKAIVAAAGDAPTASRAVATHRND